MHVPTPRTTTTPRRAGSPSAAAHRSGFSIAMALVGLAAGLGLTRGVAGQCQTLTDILRPGAGERFDLGRIGLSADGSTLVVGNGSAAAAYFYTRQNGLWVRQATFTGTFFFGRGITMSSDGGIVAVGSENGSNPAALVNIYTRTAGVWSLAQTITYNGPGGGFGTAPCMTPDGSMLFVGQFQGTSSDRCVHVYTRTNGVYTHTAQLLPEDPNVQNFSQQLACSADGRVVAASAVDRTFVFTRTGQTWTRKQVLVTPGGAPGSNSSCNAVSADGSRIFIGKPDLEVVYCFTDTGPSYVLSQTLTPPGSATTFGHYVALSPAGGTLLMGTSGAWGGVGAVYAYGETAGWWDMMAPRIDPPVGLSSLPAFGFQVATNGTLLVVGASNDGAASEGSLCTFTMGAAGLFGVVDQPDSVEAQPGGQAAFTVGVTPGATVTYQWRRNGAVLADGVGVNGTTVSGSTTAALTVAGLAHADNGAVFDCIIRSSCGATVTRAASLSVGADCPTDFNNDGFVDFFDYDDFVAAFEGGC